MPPRLADAAAAEYLANFLTEGVDLLITQIDKVVARRPDDRGIPVILLQRKTGPDTTHRDAARTAQLLVSYYRHRLSKRDGKDRANLVPHSLIEDQDFAT